MNTRILSILALTALLGAVPVAAQTAEPSGEERTNPSAASIVPDSGLTLTGEVESWNSEHMTVSTTTGSEHFVLTPDTRWPGSFEAGEKVAVDYTRTSQGVMIAQEIRRYGSATATVTTTAATDLDATAEEIEADVESAYAEVEEEAEEVAAEIDQEMDEIEADLDDEVTYDERERRYEYDELPATASDLPLVMLLGLGALGAAAGLNRLS